MTKDQGKLTANAQSLQKNKQKKATTQNLRLDRIPASTEVIRTTTHAGIPACASGNGSDPVLTALPRLATIGISEQILVLEARAGGNVNSGRERRPWSTGVDKLLHGHRVGGIPRPELGDAADDEHALAGRHIIGGLEGGGDIVSGGADGDDRRRGHGDGEGGAVGGDAAVAVGVLDVLYFCGVDVAGIVRGSVCDLYSSACEGLGTGAGGV